MKELFLQEASLTDPELRSALYRGYRNPLPQAEPELAHWIKSASALLDEALAAWKPGSDAQALQKVLDNSLIRSVARPILAPGETEDLETVYGVPCWGETPCQPAEAKVWRLYSSVLIGKGEEKHRILVPHRGPRAMRIGRTFKSLVGSYLEESERREAILSSLEGSD